MNCEKVTVEALRDMAAGETVVFQLPSPMAVGSGQTLTYKMQHMLGCRFTTKGDYAACTLTVTKAARDDNNDNNG